MASVQYDDSDLISKITDFSKVDLKFSRVGIVKATCLWKIKEINSKIPFMENEINSEIFQIKEERFYVHLSEGDTSDYLFVCLYPATQCEKDILVKFKCCILDDKGEENHTEIFQHLYPVNSSDGWGCQIYASKTMLSDHCAKLFPNDVLTFRFEISVASDKKSIFLLHNECECKELRQSQIRDFSSLMDSEKHSDCIISVKGVEIKVHKLFLSARSLVFASEIEQETENSEKRIVIDDFDFHIVLRMVNFIYTSEIRDIEVESLLSLLAISKRYEIKDLNILCQERLMWNLRIDNATSVFIAADKCGASDLENYCLEYFKENMEHISKTFEWISYISTVPKPIKLLLLHLANLGLQQ